MLLPDFIVIGAMKAGTTTLHSSLEMHPSIEMSKFKETNFFSKRFDKGIDWYSSQFSKGNKIIGEASPSYSRKHVYPGVAERIYETLPHCKIIYVLRDPIDRLISHLHHDLYRDRLSQREIDEKVLEDPQYINASKYYNQISDYLKYFKKEKILFVEFNSLKKQPSLTLNNIFGFLGVEENEFSISLKKGNLTSKRYLIKKHDWVHQNFPKRITDYYHKLFYLLDKKIERPVLKSETILLIKESLEEDINSLKNLTGKDFGEWKTYNSINLKKYNI